MRGRFLCQITGNSPVMPRCVPAGGVQGFTLTGALHYKPWPSLGQAKVNVAHLHHNYTIFLRQAHFGQELCY